MDHHEKDKEIGVGCGQVILAHFGRFGLVLYVEQLSFSEPIAKKINRGFVDKKISLNAQVKQAAMEKNHLAAKPAWQALANHVGEDGVNKFLNVR